MSYNLPLPSLDMILVGWRCACPKCHKGHVFKGRFNFDLKERCEFCDLPLHKNDSADGPAVFINFILSVLIVPIALVVEFTMAPPLWVHLLVWPIIVVVLTLMMLKPIKAYVMALQYKYRPNDWR